KQRRIAWRGAAEGIEPRSEVAIATDGLGQVHGSDDLLQREPVGRLGYLVRRRRPGLEQRSGLRIDRGGILPIPLERFEHVSPVEAGEFLPWTHKQTILAGAKPPAVLGDLGSVKPCKHARRVRDFDAIPASAECSASSTPSTGNAL